MKAGLFLRRECVSVAFPVAAGLQQILVWVANLQPLTESSTCHPLNPAECCPLNGAGDPTTRTSCAGHSTKRSTRGRATNSAFAYCRDSLNKRRVQSGRQEFGHHFCLLRNPGPIRNCCLPISQLLAGCL